jgi:hypothetical protein
VSTITREQLGQFLTGFEHTAYRLEVLDFYADDSEAPAFAAFTAGQSPDIYPGKRGWLDKVRAATATGRIMQRVHVVTEPLNSYLQFEIGWSYELNEGAGEDIRILPTDHAPIAVKMAGDYWLFDSDTLIRMEYDDRGRLVKLDHISDTDAITTANDIRDAALRHAVPRKQYAERQLLRAP